MTIRITKSQAYNYPAKELAEIECSICKSVFTRKISSIRANINKNGDFICHKCIIKSESYLSKQRLSHPKTDSKWSSKVSVKCVKCGKNYEINYRSMKWASNHNKYHCCQSCVTKTAHESGKFNYSDEFINKLKENGRRFWDENRDKWKSSYMSHLLNDDEYIELMMDSGKKAWLDQEFRDLMVSDEVKSKRLKSLSKTLEDPAYRVRLSENSKRNWTDDEYRRVISEKSKARMCTPEGRASASINGSKPWIDNSFREKMALVRASQPRVSSIQVLLYSFLDDLGVDYFKEGPDTVIGFYCFDCLIPGKKNLLIECQGDYWHSLDNVVSRDRSKFTYISRYFPEFEIMYLWEREFYSKDRVLDRLKLKLGIDIETVDFNFSDVEIFEPSGSEVKSFLDSYHYIGSGRGGIRVGARVGDSLIAVAVFSPPLRQNMDFGGDFRELSRFCIHPCYHKKNFGSWLLSRFIKSVKDVPLIVAYSDGTVGHDGGLYKASNFKLSHSVEPDYWYVDRDGYVMHKRTLYGRAVNLGMKESEFAEKHGYSKKFGGPKKCWVIKL